MKRLSTLSFTAITMTILATGASTATAQPVEAAPAALETRFGVRGGMTVDADSFFGGAHMAIEGIGGLAALRIEPLIEVGFGSSDSAFGNDVDYILARAGANAKYFFALNPEQTFRAHAAVNLSLYYAKVSDCEGDFCDDTEGGLSLGGGVEFGQFGLDAFIGLSDASPDFTVAALLTF